MFDPSQQNMKESMLFAETNAYEYWRACSIWHISPSMQSQSQSQFQYQMKKSDVYLRKEHLFKAFYADTHVFYTLNK